MKNNSYIRNLGENKLIKLIEKLVLKKTGKELIRDDSFFFEIKNENFGRNLVLNSDMLVSTTDVPLLMSSYQIGRKSILMNVSDLLVKGVEPRGLIISFGLPTGMKKLEFLSLLNGIIDYSREFDLDYIGGDINETKELIINPTVFGFKDPLTMIYRKGINVGDILVINNKFGLTGVGFDILLRKNGNLKEYPDYNRSITSVLEPKLSGIEASVLSEKNLATSSIDSSDGLFKSLKDLMLSNPKAGFEIYFNDNLIDEEAIKYSNEFNANLESLVFNAGEEFIHLFTIDPKNYNTALKEVQLNSGHIFEIGKVISDEGIFIVKQGERKEIKSYGFEHFVKKS